MGRKSSLVKIRRKYTKRFPGANLHHPVPKSRIPFCASREERMDNHLMVFPYDRSAHSAYHVLFWNMRIDEVWDSLADIHYSIFNSSGDFVSQWWLKCCRLESANNDKKAAEFENDKNEISEKLMDKGYIQNTWVRAFGGRDLKTAKDILETTMLFMIFGENILDKNKLFDNGNLSDFFENNKPTGFRLWAFNIIFGEGGSVQGIKSKIAHILNKNRYYSP